MKKSLGLAIGMMAATVAPSFAASSFQYTCSNIAYAYSGNNAVLQAVCLRANGTPNPSTLVLQGISNQNGKLVQGSGPASFQQSCGNILIAVSGANVTLSAYCRTTSGSSNPTSLPLNNINNNNGNLTQ